jgi:nucleotide-binding universal stress UspA family protein
MSSRHIVLGLDGSPGAQAAARWCAAYAGPLDADVVAVTVVAPVLAGSLPQPTAPVGLTDQERASLTVALEQWCSPLRDAAVDYDARVVEGVPAGSLMQIADDVDAALIVVGRRGDGGVAELVLGSVPRKLTHHCTRPVLVVPAQ